MPRPKAGQAAKPRQGFSWKWLWPVVPLGAAAIVLHQIPRATDVTLHLTTERVSFTPAGVEEVVLVRGLPLASLAVRGLPMVGFEVEELREGRRALMPGAGRIALESTGRESDLAMQGEGLRLMGLVLGASTRVTLYTDREGHVIVEAEKAQGSRIEVGLLGELSVNVKDYTLKDVRGRGVPFGTADPVHRLQVRLPTRNLVLEPEGDTPFTLVLRPAGPPGPSESVGMPLGITPRLKVTSLDFTRREGTRLVPAILRLWIEPLVPKDKPLEAVFLGIPPEKVFTLQSVVLSGGHLACELTGTTATLRIGRDAPRENLVPSLLQYLVNHAVFRTVCKPVGLC